MLRTTTELLLMHPPLQRLLYQLQLCSEILIAETSPLVTLSSQISSLDSSTDSPETTIRLPWKLATRAPQASSLMFVNLSLISEPRITARSWKESRKSLEISQSSTHTWTPAQLRLKPIRMLSATGSNIGKDRER